MVPFFDSCNDYNYNSEPLLLTESLDATWVFATFASQGGTRIPIENKRAGTCVVYYHFSPLITPHHTTIIKEGLKGKGCRAHFGVTDSTTC